MADAEKAQVAFLSGIEAENRQKIKNFFEKVLASRGKVRYNIQRVRKYTHKLTHPVISRSVPQSGGRER